MQVPRSTSVTDLGILYVNKLSFHLHIDNITKKALRSLGFLIRLCENFKKPESLSTLFKAYVLPILEYCSPVIPFNTKAQIDKLERIQKKYLKLLAFKSTGLYPMRGCDYLDLCNTFDTDTLGLRRSCASALIGINVIRGKIHGPALLNELPI